MNNADCPFKKDLIAGLSFFGKTLDYHNDSAIFEIASNNVEVI